LWFVLPPELDVKPSEKLDRLEIPYHHMFLAIFMSGFIYREATESR
jgi:hypothetical protein